MMDRRHQQFLKQLDESQPTVALVARWLSGRGYVVEIPEVSRAEKHSDWKKHADEGDLIGLRGDKKFRLEVKRLGIDFTCCEDWKYTPYFMVCNKHSWDRAQVKPSAYYIVNKAGTHLAMVRGSTHSKWTVGTRSDSRMNAVGGHTQEFYFCPMDLLIFREM